MRNFILVNLIVLMFSTSCNWINPSEEIPSYIRIDTIDFSVIGSQGTDNQSLVDAWVFVDGQKIGVFELPCTFPILKSGNVDIEVFPGIKLNGISATRAIYPFVNSYKISSQLVQDSVLQIYPTSTYYSNLEFEIIEDFESGGLTLHASSLSDTSIERTSDPAEVFEGTYSGIIEIDAERPKADIKSVDPFALPQGGAYNFIEINFKTNVEVAVGVIANQGTLSVYHAVMVLNRTDEWKKIYVNLSPIISREALSSSFYIFFRVELPDDVSHGKVYLDNVKLIHAE